MTINRYRYFYACAFDRYGDHLFGDLSDFFDEMAGALQDHDNRRLEIIGLRRDMLLQVVPEEGHDVLPEDSTPWARELPSPTSHSNRSLRTEVSVVGKRNFHGRDKAAETALEIQGRRCRDRRRSNASSRRRAFGCAPVAS